MKFSMDSDRVRTRLTASTGEYDGTPPVPNLEIGLNLNGITTADRLAVGLALIYSPWLAGPFQTPDPVSALTAQRVTEFFGERFVTVTTVTDRALPIPRGVQRVTVIDLATAPDSTPSEARLSLAPFSLRESSLSFGNQHTVASNIHIFGPLASQLHAGNLHTLGLAVMLAEHADASVLVHPAAAVQVPGLDLLLESVGLGLTGA